MTHSAHPTNPGRPAWRMPALIGGIIVLAVVAGLLFAFVINRHPETAAGNPSPSLNPSPSAPVSPSAEPSPSQEPAPTEAPEPTEVAAPDDWTLVHQFGDGSTRWAGGEIAFGNAGFLAIGRRYEGGEGGPRIAEYGMWQSADGLEWKQVDYPNPGDGGSYDPSVLTAAADGSYVLHAMQVTPEVPEVRRVSLRSIDGTTWEPIETGMPAEMFVQSVEAEGPAGYLLVGGQGRNIDPTLWLSGDGLTWELVHEFTQDTHYMQIHSADAGTDGYVVIGRRIQPDSSSYERFAFASADGREWVESAAPFGPDDQAYVWDVAVTSHGGNWLATIGDRNELITLYSSADGLEWTAGGTIQGPERSLASPGLFEEISAELIYSPGATISFGGTPGTFSSTDGTTWSPIDALADAYLAQLAAGDGVLVVTGTILGADGVASTGGIWIRASD